MNVVTNSVIITLECSIVCWTGYKLWCSYFSRFDDQFVLANFDSAPTGDSESYEKLSAADRDEYERRVSNSSIM